MIDHDLSRQLHSLAATVDEPFDLAALQRRISMRGRRRAAVKVGVAGAGVAAIVGGLFVVGDDHPRPAGSGPAAASPVRSQAEPTALPDCAAVLAGLRTEKAFTDTIRPKDTPTEASAGGGDAPRVGFKGIVTILAIDGPRLTFHNDQPDLAPPTSGVGTLDAATVWVDGGTALDPPPALAVGEQVALATTRADDGLDHVIFVDVGASPSVDEQAAADKKAAMPAGPSTADPDASVIPGATLPPGPTEKSSGTVTAVDATSITVTLDDLSGQTRTFAIDLATTPFTAGDTPCLPGSPPAGSEVGVAFHFDEAGNVIGDRVMLVP